MAIFIVVVLIFIGFVLFAAYTQSVKRIHYADYNIARREVSEGEGRLPSWYSPYTLTEKTKECLLLVSQSLKDHGHSEEEIISFLKNEEAMLAALYIAGQMETKGSSFFSQKVAISEFFIDVSKNDFIHRREKRDSNEKSDEEELQDVINILINDLSKSPKIIDSWDYNKKITFQSDVLNNKIITDKLSEVDIDFLKNHPTGEIIYIIANELYENGVTDNDKVVFITAMIIKSLIQNYEYDFMYRLVNEANN